MAQWHERLQSLAAQPHSSEHVHAAEQLNEELRAVVLGSRKPTAACLQPYMALDITPLLSCLSASTSLFYISAVLRSTHDQGMVEAMLASATAAVDAVAHGRQLSWADLQAHSALCMVATALSSAGLMEGSALERSRAGVGGQRWGELAHRHVRKMHAPVACAVLALSPGALGRVGSRLAEAAIWCWGSGCTLASDDMQLLRDRVAGSLSAAGCDAARGLVRAWQLGPAIDTQSAVAMLANKSTQPLDVLAASVLSTKLVCDVGHTASKLQVDAIAPAQQALQQRATSIASHHTASHYTTQLCAIASLLALSGLASPMWLRQVACNMPSSLALVMLCAYCIGRLGGAGQARRTKAGATHEAAALAALSQLARAHPDKLGRLLCDEGLICWLVKTCWQKLSGRRHAHLVAVLRRAAEDNAAAPALAELLEVQLGRPSAERMLAIESCPPGAPSWAAYAARAIIGDQPALASARCGDEVLLANLMLRATELMMLPAIAHSPDSKKVLAHYVHTVALHGDTPAPWLAAALDTLAELSAPSTCLLTVLMFLSRDDVNHADCSVLLGCRAVVDAGRAEPQLMCTVLNQAMTGAPSASNEGRAAIALKVSEAFANAGMVQAAVQAGGRALGGLAWEPRLQRALAPQLVARVLDALDRGLPDVQVMLTLERSLLLERMQGGQRLIWQALCLHREEACDAMDRLLSSDSVFKRMFCLTGLLSVWEAAGWQGMRVLLGGRYALLDRMQRLCNRLMRATKQRVEVLPAHSFRVLRTIALAGLRTGPQPGCTSCGKARDLARQEGTPLRRCRCVLRPVYCSVACQARHWQEGHSEDCMYVRCASCGISKAEAGAAQGKRVRMLRRPHASFCSKGCEDLHTGLCRAPACACESQ